jgi:hypothetical protein
MQPDLNCARSLRVIGDSPVRKFVEFQGVSDLGTKKGRPKAAF